MAVMIDAAHYFHNLAKLFGKARKRIMILGWDLHTEVRLTRQDKNEQTLTDSLHAALKNNRELHVYILIWEFSPVYFSERELFQKLKLSRRFWRRLHFVYDGQHPLGASHHQKLVIIDEHLAFCGGIDLTSNRWDEPEHKARHSDRRNPNGELYQPFHDLQVVVDGELAKSLASLARLRWQRACGETLPAVSIDHEEKDLQLSALVENPELRWDWPLTCQKAAIKLTMPTYKKWDEIRQIETSYVNLIEEATDYIYIENQYFTSTLITEKLSACLSREQPPEVVIILPEMAEGFLEREAMLRLQDSCLKKLRKSDHKQRLRVFFPFHQDLSDSMQIKVHSKLIIVDDRFIELGSANLNNRSMGLDTECDIWAECSEDQQRQRLQLFLAHELAHFYADADTKTISETLKKQGLIATIDQLNQAETKRGLKGLDESRRENPSFSDWPILDQDFLDWQRPLSVERMIDRTIYQPNRRKTRLFRSLPMRAAFTLVSILIFAGLINYLDLDLKASFHYLRETFDLRTDSIMQNLMIAITVFAIGGLLMIPVNLLILTYASLFQGIEAVFYILAGVAASAASGYGVGRILSNSFLHRLIPKRFFEIAKKIRSRHLLPIILVRTAPVAPFSLINLLAGSFHVNFSVYFFGTLLGILPGVISLVFFQNSLFELIKNPSWQNALIFGAALSLVIYLFYSLNRRLSTPDEQRAGEGSRAGP